MSYAEKFIEEYVLYWEEHGQNLWDWKITPNHDEVIREGGLLFQSQGSEHRLIIFLDGSVIFDDADTSLPNGPMVFSVPDYQNKRDLQWAVYASLPIAFLETKQT